jgi:hypothetical protein
MCSLVLFSKFEWLGFKKLGTYCYSKVIVDEGGASAIDISLEKMKVVLAFRIY